MANPALAGSASKFADLKKRIWFVVGALIVYRIGAHIPVPGINPVELANLFQSSQTGLLNMFNMFSGGALSRFTVFAIGIMPYISASIIVQLAGEVLPSLKQLKKEGESGKRKLTQYTRYFTVLLASAQSFGIAMMLFRQPNLVVMDQGMFVVMTMISLVTGTMFLMWLGEQITERGMGNGISILICAGIAAGVPSAIAKTLTLSTQGSLPILLVLFLFVGVVLLTAAVVYVERGQRKVPIQYAKRQVGNRLMQAQSSFLPLKVNMAGVIPPIFASSIILFPATVLSWTGNSEKLSWLKSLGDMLHPGQPLYVLFYAAAIIFFCFFYTALVFSPRETADNLKKSGAMVPGYRPGDHTAKYVEKVILRLTLVGAVYITIICLIPEFLILKWNVPFYFGGTSLLIMVVVTMDFMAQLQSYVLSHQYEGLLKKANFKG
ncbi:MULTISPECIES: preprotein translocase subunit SecY [Deefgea]|uniref:Protein translocase subunit SecY n=1 Tax=Deefgea chitinilytica TaxID=570276 RepID=A0ABS2CCL1_9NEIS|nr:MULTISPECIES: preprotein translocase subunit SecY [Deefgea]MBM5571869.1 preprotein translocase subunit SecY [Deefgea chitinilytica]MBM9889104.1 preprotein translocase subunit SecY [Deefgea sp. CFH1-16]